MEGEDKGVGVKALRGEIAWHLALLMSGRLFATRSATISSSEPTDERDIIASIRALCGFSDRSSLEAIMVRTKGADRTAAAGHWAPRPLWREIRDRLDI